MVSRGPYGESGDGAALTSSGSSSCRTWGCWSGVPGGAVSGSTGDSLGAEWSDVRYNLGWVTLPGYGPRPYPSELFDAHWKSYSTPLTAFLSCESSNDLRRWRSLTHRAQWHSAPRYR